MFYIFQQNAKIEAIIPHYLIQRLVDKIKEYQVIILSKFMVEDFNDPWKLVPHPCIINVLYSTEIQQSKYCSISPMGIEPVDFDQIITGQLKEHSCVGMLTISYLYYIFLRLNILQHLPFSCAAY